MRMGNQRRPPNLPPLASAPAWALGALQPRDPEALLHPGKHPGHPKSGPASVIRKLSLAQPKDPRPPSDKQGGQRWPGHWAAETWGGEDRGARGSHSQWPFYSIYFRLL